jgi:predicted DNA-binding helix-hairpin-helix protein
MMAGSTNEDDRTILTLSHALYKKYKLKRVYYTPFQYTHPAKGYELPQVRTPHWRMRRLYQADRLMQLYGFKPDDITPADYLFLEEDIDPKAAWVLRHLDRFPVEVNTADYHSLLRIPGIGTTYAQRIIQGRKICRLTFETLKKMKIPLVKSGHFITCGGLYYGALEDDVMKMRGLLCDVKKEKEGGSLDVVWCD